MTCFVYIIATMLNDGPAAPVKVGIANDPFSRLKSVQTGNPHRLRLLAAIAVPDRSIAVELERAFHSVMDQYRMHGEWFNISPAHASDSLRLNLAAMLHVSGASCEQGQIMIEDAFWPAEAFDG